MDFGRNRAASGLVVVVALCCAAACGNSTVLFGRDQPVPPPPQPNLNMTTSGLVSQIDNGNVMSNVTLKISNESGTTVGKPFSVAAVLNSGASETWLNSWSVPSVEAGASADLNVSFTIPSAVIAGPYTMVFKVDEGNNIIESDETDNDSSSSLQVDQRTDTLNLTPVKVAPDYATGTGPTANLFSFRIWNGGSGTLNAEPFTWRIYFSYSNPSLDPGDELAYEGSNFDGSVYQSIPPSGYIEYVNLNIGKPTGNGIYHLILVVDQEGAIPETLVNDNTETQLFTCFTCD